MPLVSIIVPVFNCELYISDCVQSITRQSESDLEIVVVDDGSTDGTAGVIKELASQDSRVVISSQKNSGFAGAARNVGLARSSGRYIAFLDADDQYHPDRIRRSVSVLENHPGTEIVFHDHKRFQRDPERDEAASFLEQTEFVSRAAAYLERLDEKVYRCRSDFYVFASLEFVPFHTSSVLFSRQVLAPKGPWFREDIYPGEDGDLWLRLTRDRRVAFLNETLSYYRSWSGGITRDQSRYLQTSIQIHTDNLRRGKDVFDGRQTQLYRSKIARQLFELGYCYFAEHRVREARREYARSMALDFSVDSLGSYLKTFVPESLIREYRIRGGKALAE